MSDCARRQAYLDEVLTPEERRCFEAHLVDCAPCRSAVALWQAATRRLRDRAVQQQRWAPSARSTARLLGRANEVSSTARRNRLRLTVLLAATASLAVAVGGVALIQRSATEPPEEQLVATVEEGAGRRTAREGETVIASAARLKLVVAADQMSLTRGGKLRLERLRSGLVRLRVASGSLTAEVSPRRGAQRFVVLGEDLTVEVVGTHFSVQPSVLGGGRIAVERGVVEVRRDHQTPLRVTAGQTLVWEGGLPPQFSSSGVGAAPALPELQEEVVPEVRPTPDRSGGQLGAPAVVVRPLPSKAPRKAQRPVTAAPAARDRRVETWEQQVISGQYAEVEQALRDYLAANGDDVEVASLLGDVLRKQKKWRPAVHAYAAVTRLGDAALANRARYLAAGILHHELRDTRAAATLLRAYLGQRDNARPLRAAATVQLARCSLAAGDRKEAETLLVSVAGFGDAAATREAEQLLRELEGQ